MADSYLDKRQREVEESKATGLHGRDEAMGQLQALESEKRNTLAMQRQQAAQDQEKQQLLGQAAELSTFDQGTQEVLSKYGMRGPVRVSSRQVKTVPPNITIINNNTTNNGVGPTSGREIAFKQPKENSTSRFKTWISNVLMQQKEENNKRERLFARRESELNRNSSKMLARIADTSKDLATQFNPKNIGQSVGNQFKILLMLFVGRFLAKHWTKVLDGITWVGNKIGSALDYFGVTDKGRQLADSGGGFKGDVIGFFGGDPKKENLFDVFKKMGTELVDYLKMKLDHAFELRGDAIKSIKFPPLTGDIPNMLSGIAGYLGDILAAIVDPKTGLKNNFRTQLGGAGLASSKKNQDTNFSRSQDYAGLKDTSSGDAMITGTVKGKRNYSLDSSQLDSSGKLKNTDAAGLSQSMDILGAVQNASSGKIDTARLASGLQRLQDQAKSRGGVTVDSEFVREFIGSDLGALARKGYVKPRYLKLIQVKKGEEDLAAEGASGFAGTFIRDESAYAIGDTIGDYTHSNMLGSLASSAAGGPGVDPITGTILQKTGLRHLLTLGRGTVSAVKRGLANNYTLKLVDASDPRPGIKGGFITAYTLTPEALNWIANKKYGAASVDSSNFKFVKSIENSLIKRAGGAANVKERDIEDLGSQFQAIKDFEDKSAYFDAQEAGHAAVQRWSGIGNRTMGMARSAWNAVGNGISWIGGQVKEVAINNKEAARRVKEAMKILKSDGWSDNQAAAIVGNMLIETGRTMSTTIKGDNGKALGLCQWHPDRQAKLAAFAQSTGSNPLDFETQVKFASYELKNHEVAAGQKLYNSRNLEDSTYVVLHDFERAAETYWGGDNHRNRLGAAKVALRTLNSPDEEAENILKDVSSYSPGPGNNLSLSSPDATVSNNALFNTGEKIEGAGDWVQENNPVTGVKTDFQMQNENAKNTLRSEASRFWRNNSDIQKSFDSYKDFEKYWVSKDKKTRQAMSEGLTAWKNHKNAILGNVETSKMTALSFAEAWSKLPPGKGWKYINSWEKHYKIENGGDSFISKNLDWLESAATGSTGTGTDNLVFDKNLGGHVQGDRKEYAKGYYNRILRGEETKHYSDSAAAGILFGDDYIKTAKAYEALFKDHPGLKKVFEKKLKGEKLNNSELYLLSSDNGILEQATGLKDVLGKYEKAAAGYTKEMSASSDKSQKTQRAIYSKYKGVADLTKKYQELQNEKASLDATYNKLLSNANSDEEKARLYLEYRDKYEHLKEKEAQINQSIEKLNKEDKKEIEEFIKKSEQQKNLMSANIKTITSKFGEMKKKGMSSIEAINQLINEYGEEVIKFLQDQLSKELGYNINLSKDDFNTSRDYAKEYADQQKFEAEHPGLARPADDIGQSAINQVEISKTPTGKAMNVNPSKKTVQFAENFRKSKSVVKDWGSIIDSSELTTYTKWQLNKAKGNTGTNLTVKGGSANEGAYTAAFKNALVNQTKESKENTAEVIKSIDNMTETTNVGNAAIVKVLTGILTKEPVVVNVKQAPGMKVETTITK